MPIMFAWSEFEKLIEDAALLEKPNKQPVRKAREALDKEVTKLQSNVQGMRKGTGKGKDMQLLPWEKVDGSKPGKKGVAQRKVGRKA